MLKVSKGKLMFIVPFYWIDGWGFLKPEAVCILAVFFGDMTNQEADEELVRRLNTKRRHWIT